jgi:hypothetical protein
MTNTLTPKKKCVCVGVILGTLEYRTPQTLVFQNDEIQSYTCAVR